MQIMHPQGSYKHFEAEDVFLAIDDKNNQVGVGTIEYHYLPHRCPDCPVQLYFTLDSQPDGWFMLMGALMARARQLRDASPMEAARMYTRISPDNRSELERYAAVGMDCSQFESLIGLTPRSNEVRNLMGFQVEQVPLNTTQEQTAFLNRLMSNDIFHIDLPYLQYLLRMPHFYALGLRYNGAVVCEAMVAGSGDACELMAVYTVPQFRRHGLATRLVNQCMNIMATEGVKRFAAVLVSLSEPQKHLAMDFHGVDLQMQAVFPCLDL